MCSNSPHDHRLAGENEVLDSRLQPFFLMGADIDVPPEPRFSLLVALQFEGNAILLSEGGRNIRHHRVEALSSGVLQE